MTARHAVHDLIDARNLEIHFMPIVRLMNRVGSSAWRSFAFEALVRGPEGHPLRNPAQLFPAAEREGVRNALELLCVEAALDQQRTLPHGTRLFVNVGLTTFLSTGFMDVIDRADPQGPGPRAVVEVLEDEMPEARSFRERVRLLEGRGFEVALDDLAADALTFQRLVASGPVRYWKLDRSVLTQWAGRASWVRDWLPMVADAAQDLGIEIVIEGLENPHLPLVPTLCDLGIGLGQGYAFGKPAILGPGLGQWRHGICPMISSIIPLGAPPLVPVQLEPRVRDRLALASR